MMREKFIPVGVLIALSICALLCLWLVQGSSEVAAGQADKIVSDKTELGTVWRLNSREQFILSSATSEGDVGKIQYARDGQTIATWKTGCPSRQYGAPLVMGAYPEQVIAVPFEVGGGTGVGEYHWVLVTRSEKKVFWKHMGLWAYWSHGKDEIDFSLSPYLLHMGKDLQFDFRQAVRARDQVNVVAGRLSLAFRVDGQSSLMPINIQDAMALIQLLESPLDSVRKWARGVIQACLPAELIRVLADQDWRLTSSSKKAISKSLNTLFSK